MAGVVAVQTLPERDVPESGLMWRVDSEEGWLAGMRLGGRLESSSADYAAGMGVLDGGNTVEGDSLRLKEGMAVVRAPVRATVDVQGVFRCVEAERTSLPDDSGGPR